MRNPSLRKPRVWVFFVLNLLAAYAPCLALLFWGLQHDSWVESHDPVHWWLFPEAPVVVPIEFPGAFFYAPEFPHLHCLIVLVAFLYGVSVLTEYTHSSRASICTF